jgi:hypothetical protein
LPLNNRRGAAPVITSSGTAGSEWAQRKLLAAVKDFDLNYYTPNGGWSTGQTAPHMIRTEKTMYLMF